MTRTTSLAPLLQRFFIQRLIQQRRASPHTISSYRDTFRQFLKFAHQRLGRPPSRLAFEQFDAPLITAFLDDLETRRGLSVRSRNLRLTAIHSFFRYAAFELPTHAAQIQRVLAIPSKRFHAQAGRLSQPPGGRCIAGRTGSDHLVGTARPRLHPHRSANGASAVRDDRAQASGLRLRKRNPPAGRRQGPQGALYTAGQAHPSRAEGLAARAVTRRRRRALSQRQRRAADSPWGAVPVEQAPRRGRSQMPLIDTPAAAPSIACGTPRPWTFFRPARCGSDTNRSKQPRSTWRQR